MLRKLRPLLILSIFLTLLSVASGVVFAKENEKHIRVCPKSGGKEVADCHSRVIVDQNGIPKASTVPSGYGPAQFRGAYNLSGVVFTSTTIAIVDAYDHPNIYSDLLVYRSAFGITTPLGNCPVSTGTPSSPCFQKVDQNGGTRYPKVNAGWALEIALDVEVAHAICQNCNILLVEAKSNSYADLMTAVDRAVSMGANVISNSYGSSEFSGETAYDSHFNVSGRAFTFSSGDAGYGTSYPAASQYVTAIGGTTLTLNLDNTYYSETAWSGAGSGCSLYEIKPLWQTDSGCSRRTIADVSADADPNTGAAVYDSVRYQGRQGWFKVGGTSLASPLIAGVYALSGNTSGPANSLPYSSNPSLLHDITFGSNGSCGGSYLCTAVSGYDGPTGLGSPNGSGAF